MLQVRTVAGVAALLLATACWRAAPPAPATFGVARVSPAEVEEGGPLLLNDSITVYFTDAIHPLSVTSDSITVLDAHGQAVPGSLRTGTNWATFAPEPPLDISLTDGSFRPGEVYRLIVAGYPRPDAVRAADGRRLDAVQSFELRTADVGPFDAPQGRLPAPLRPPSTDLPFLLRPYDVPQQLPADAPRFRLHFTLPVLPASARPEAFVIQLARGPQRLLARGVRVVSSRLDQYPGSTIEIDLGAEPRLADGTGFETLALRAGDWLSVTFAGGDDSLRDLAGNPVLPSLPQPWSVVAGASLPLISWPPAVEGGIVGDDPLWPGFEAVSGIVRPRLRVEAGDGSLGFFRPQRDTVLRPGVPFDRGDGVKVQSHGAKFPFLAIDVPEGVRVRVEGRGGAVQLLACGGVRVAGTLELAGLTGPIPSSQQFPHGIAAAELVDQSPLALVAAGDVRLEGAIATALPLPSNQTALTIASAGRIHLLGELPYNTVLAVESSASRRQPAIPGTRGQTFVTSVTFTPGAPETAGFTVRGVSPWRQMALDRDGGALRLIAVDSGLRVEWQAVPADPVHPSAPDLRPDRMPRPRATRDGEWIAFDPGSFVRFLIEAEIGAGRQLPGLQELRLVDR